jgi:hypothetical protein
MVQAFISHAALKSGASKTSNKEEELRGCFKV